MILFLQIWFTATVLITYGYILRKLPDDIDRRIEQFFIGLLNQWKAHRALNAEIKMRKAAIDCSYGRHEMETYFCDHVTVKQKCKWCDAVAEHEYGCPW